MTIFWVILVIVVVAAVAVFYGRRSRASTAQELADARAEARRWVERLGGQVYAIDTRDNAAARQALADAAERFTAAGSQVDQATSAAQYRLAQQTAYEGLYYVRAARTTLGLDPGPELPAMPGQQQAGQVSEDRRVSVEGRDYEASPVAGDRTRHYYPGGVVAGRPVPGGWYSEPWWQPALTAGAWGVGTYLVASTLFSGMAGIGGSWAYDAGYDAGLADGGNGADSGADAGADGGDFSGGGDGGGWGGDIGSGGDFGGGDFGGGDVGGGGDFGGF